MSKKKGGVAGNPQNHMAQRLPVDMSNMDDQQILTVLRQRLLAAYKRLYAEVPDYIEALSDVAHQEAWMKGENLSGAKRSKAYGIFMKKRHRHDFRNFLSEIEAQAEKYW